MSTYIHCVVKMGVHIVLKSHGARTSHDCNVQEQYFVVLLNTVFNTRPWRIKAFV